jgi:hypothetical protein
MTKDFTLTNGVLSNGKTVYYAKLNNSTESKFLIGIRTKYDVNFGMYNTSVTQNQVYAVADYEAQFGFWASFILPTVMAESAGSFKCLNTYDRAKFTFTFMQFAAHVPNGDFIKFFKKLLQLPNAKTYFPRLELHNNRIFYLTANGTLNQLEDDQSTQKLMDYFNPSLDEVENQELICAARMVHWCTNDPEHRKIQVEFGISLYKNNMKSYSQRFNLHHAPAKVCLLICDILHQGRGTYDRIANCLNTNGNYEKAYTNLCTVGNALYQKRIDTVKNNINKMIESGKFNMKYDSIKQDFVKM